MGDWHTIALDFETYYDQQYSLRKMSVPQYILDPRYETIMCAVQVDFGEHQTIDGPDVGRFLSQFDPATTSTIAFNALFDNAILSYVYGFVPARIYDTMGMVRALRGHLLRKGASLKAVAKVLGLPDKMDTIANVMGMRAAEIKQRGLWPEFSAYAKLDNQLSVAIFNKLFPEFPKSERQLADMVLRCALEPRFMLDEKLLTEHLVDVRRDKAALLTQAGTTVADLMSGAKFIEALHQRGVEIEYKPSKTNTEKMIPALAKDDEFMAELAEHPDPVVQALAAARLGHKSTIEETRAEKLLTIAALPWHRYRDGNPRLATWSGTMPIPLAYGKAHTHRLAGDWGMNMQNLPAGRSGVSKLRKALIAPPGHKVITCDLGQIEARLTAWFCDALDLLGQFANDLDPYAKMGEVIFGYLVDPKVNKMERFIGKTAILGLGYGCGSARFYDMVVKLARNLKMDLGGVWTVELAGKSVDAYRRAHRQIPTRWRLLDTILATNWLGKNGVIKLGPVEIGHGYVRGPNDLYLRYDNPRQNELGEYVYDYGRETHKIYGAKLLENIVQFLARIVVMHAALRIRGHAPTEAWSRFVLQAHDELVFIVPDAKVEEAKQIIHSEMIRRPSWAPTIPLKADVGVGQSYGESK